MMGTTTAAGYDALNSQGWYLDHINCDWASMYNNDPAYGVASNATHHVLGGQGEMWGETVDASDIEQTVWPRLAAIAESLWSPPEVTSCSPIFANTTYNPGVCSNLDAAFPRLKSFRCLLMQRGVRAAPVGNGEARQAPVGPGGCYA